MSEEKIRIEPLDVNNWPQWSARVKMLLILKGEWAIVSSGVTKETRGNSEADAKALARIGLLVKDHHLPAVLAADSAKELWDSLEGTFKAKTTARRLELRKQMTNLKLELDEDLTKYLARARSIQSDLTLAGQETSDSEVVLAVLSGLPQAYDIVVTVLTAADKELTLEGILPSLLPVEQKLKAEFIAPVDYAYGTRGSAGRQNPAGREGSQGKQCHYCGKLGHFRRNCLLRVSDAKGKRIPCF